MQVETNWKAAANLQLLLGESHPPARIEHDPVAPHKQAAGDGAPALHAAGGTAMIDARNTANFRTTSYCSLQDPNAPAVRRRLVSYYREMLRRIPLWCYKADDALKSEDGGAADDNSTVKREPSNDEERDQEGLETQLKREGGAAGAPSHTFRAVGILTQVHDPVGEQAVVPWEFFTIQDIEDDACFDGPVNALLKDIPQDRFPLLFAPVRPEAAGAQEGSGGSMGVNPPQQQREQLDTAERESRWQQYAQEGQRLSLYAKMLGAFTGLYPGMAVGIVGEPFQRSARGVLTGVLLRDLILPSRPVLPWRVDRPVPSEVVTPAKPTRVHFCSGPFPRRDIRALLRAVTRQALHRGADLLIVGGPLVKPFEDFEREILPSVTMPFSEMLDGFVDSLEESIAEYYATRPNIPHLKVVLVSHPDDVTQSPVLPTTMYGMADTADIYFRSNPCRIAINGVHISVCNEDVVGHMRDVMVERWPTAEGSLRRVVETLVQSRMYTPVTELPAVRMDMKHMATLRLDFVPSGNELLELESGQGTDAQRLAAVHEEKNWNLVLHLDDAVKGAKREEETEEADQKRARLEDGTVTASALATRSSDRFVKDVEYMPHIMFLPSTRPQFAYVTHRGVPASTPRDVVADESSLDDTAAASGVLVVNQEVWSRRTSQKFELRVAEVTMQDSDRVARRGASPATGVSCGVLHIFDADRR